MHQRTVAFVAALALVLGALAAVVQGQPFSGEYKIGVLEPLTGPLAGEGKRHLEGYEIVRDMINERGGVMGPVSCGRLRAPWGINRGRGMTRSSQRTVLRQENPRCR